MKELKNKQNIYSNRVEIGEKKSKEREEKEKKPTIPSSIRSPNLPYPLHFIISAPHTFTQTPPQHEYRKHNTSYTHACHLEPNTQSVPIPDVTPEAIL